MNCLHCGRPLADAQKDAGWHPRCIKRFFGTKALPQIEISQETFQHLVDESTNKGVTVPGVQKKLSMYLFSDKQPRLTLMNHPAGYILKPQVKEFEALPEAEHLVMSMAQACGIATVPHALVRLEDGWAYITRRVDRAFEPGAPVGLLAMEDFCQLDLRLTQDKYRGSYERCANIITRHSSRPGLDLSELYLRLVFCFVAGNSDMHLKNFSLLETEERSGQYALSPAYDLLPVNLVMPEDQEQTALTLNGKKANIRRKDFLLFAQNCGISIKAADRMLLSMLSFVPQMLGMVEQSLLPLDMRQRFQLLISQRAGVLEG